MSALIAAALIAELTLGVVGKGSMVRVQTRTGTVVFGTVVDENASGLTVQNGNRREVISYGDVADLTELGAEVEVAAPPPLVAAPSPPQRRDAEVEEYEKPKPVVPDPPSTLAIRANLADIAFFGPTLGAEYEVVSKLGVFVEGRLLNGGLMNALGGPYGPANFGQNYFYSLPMTLGGGGSAGLVYFFGSRKGLRGFYVGAAAEVLFRDAQLYSSQNYSDQLRLKPVNVSQTFVVPHARIGFRFRAGPMLIGLGVRGGAGLLTSASASYEGRTQNWGSSQRVYLDLSAILDVGVFVL
jgi:hypothetical protein